MVEICIKCGSDKIISKAGITGVGDGGHLTVLVDEKPDAFIFKQRMRSDISAKVCGNCGFMELYADDPKLLYSAYQKQEPKLKLVK
jgi:predicted nucleic-acid-binding Zn-ribbon protein